MSFDIGIDRSGVWNPCFAFGWLDLESMVGKGAEPDRPDAVEENGVAGDNNIINVCEDGNKVTWRGVGLGGECDVGNVGVEVVDDGTKEDAEDGG